MVDRRRTWGEDRVFFSDEAGQLARIPAQWTNVAAVDPVVALAGGRSCFRIADLLRLAELLDGIETSQVTGAGRP